MFESPSIAGNVGKFGNAGKCGLDIYIQNISFEEAENMKMAQIS